MGLELKQASAEISNAGLRPRLVGKVRLNLRSGEIARQKPQTGTLVKRGTTVEVWVSAPPSWVAVVVSAVAATVVVYVLAKIVKIVKELIWPVRVELCPVLDSGDQKLEKMGPLLAAGGD